MKNRIYVIAILLAVALSAGVLGFMLGKRRAFISRGNSMNEYTQRLVNQLDLNSEQQQKIRPLIEKTQQSTRLIAREAIVKLGIERDQFQKELRQILEPEQQQKLDQMKTELQNFRQNLLRGL
jgi:Spy/CpxP family protein refolding chaperone